MLPASAPKKILVARHDRLGDLTLALPCFEVLARGLPGARLIALVPEYTRPLVELSPFVDGVLAYPGAQVGARELAAAWKPERFDALLSLWSRPQAALAGWLARIPLRVGPASRAHQFLHNERVRQRRSRSERTEFDYNIELAAHLVRCLGGTPVRDFTRPVLAVEPGRIAGRRAALAAAHGLDPGRPWVALHPGSGGSTNHLTLEQYARLVHGLESHAGHELLLSAGPGEVELAQELARLARLPASSVFASTDGLAAFVEVLATVDLFISGSTGPLHVAGALDTPTAGFYVRRATGSSRRWSTLNSASRRLAFEPPASAGERDMAAIDVGAASRAISTTFLQART